MNLWGFKSAQMESRSIVNILQTELTKAMTASPPDSEEFGGVVEAMSQIVADQLNKRKQAKLLVSQKQAKKHKQMTKFENRYKNKQSNVAAQGNDAAAAGPHRGGGQTPDAASEMKGLETLGPVDGLKRILDKFGPQSTTELSQIYQKLTGQGFKKLVGRSVNHVLRENPTIFERRKVDKKWACCS